MRWHNGVKLDIEALESLRGGSDLTFAFHQLCELGPVT